MTTIILYGHLKELYPKEIRVEANCAAEAIQSLALIPALQRTPGERHLVRVEGFESADALYDKRHIDVLHIHPIVAGAGRGGVGQILIGIALIALAVYTGGASLTLLGASISSGSIMLSGAMMALGGVLQMLAPQPSLSGMSNEEKSRYLGSGRNTVGIGTRIPMIYGRRKAFGHYISFDIDASVFDAAPAEWYSSTFTNYGELTNSAAPISGPMADPATTDKQPTSRFNGYSSEEVIGLQLTSLSFYPVNLETGTWSMSFATGEVFTVTVTNNGGLVSKALLMGGRKSNFPPIGTSITFTRNYG